MVQILMRIRTRNGMNIHSCIKQSWTVFYFWTYFFSLLARKAIRMKRNFCFFLFSFIHQSDSPDPGSIKIVELLIEYGADVNAQDEDLNTPLHHVAIIDANHNKMPLADKISNFTQNLQYGDFQSSKSMK